MNAENQYEGWIETKRGTRIVEVSARGIRAAFQAVKAQCVEAEGEFVRGVQPLGEDA